jgi:hypothetical protein
MSSLNYKTSLIIKKKKKKKREEEEEEIAHREPNNQRTQP